MKKNFFNFSIITLLLVTLAMPVRSFAMITPAFLTQWVNDDPLYINPIDTAFATSTNQYYALFDDGYVEVFNATTGTQTKRFLVADVGEHIEGLAVHPTSGTLYVTSNQGTVKLFDPNGVFLSEYGDGVLSAPGGDSS